MNMKKQLRIKEPIKIRTKELANGCQSIYLDIYMDGKRQYEFLKLYIIPENDKTDKERNHETLKLANAIKSQKIVELQNKAFGFDRKLQSKVKLTDYMERIAELSVDNKVRSDTIHAIIQHLDRYDPKGIYSKK